MDYYRKKFKNKSSQDLVAVISEKEYKYVSLQAILKQTLLENDERKFKELLEEINNHLTELRSVVEEKEISDNKSVKQKCEKLIKQYEDCLVKLANKDKDGTENDAEKPSNQIGQKVGKGELEEKLKQMRHKRLNRLSIFVNEQAKLSEERTEQQAFAKEESEILSKTLVKTDKSEPIVEEVTMFQRSSSSTGSRVEEIRSSFGKNGAFGGTKNGPKVPLKIQTKPNLNVKSLESPKTPTQRRKFFNTISCLTEETKNQTDKLIEENDKMMNEIKHVQLKKINPTNSLETPQNSAEIHKPRSPNLSRWKGTLNRLSDIQDEPPKLPAKKSVAVAPPKVNYPLKIQPLNIRSKSDLHENWKSKNQSTISKNHSFKADNKTVSHTDLDSIIESVKRNSKEHEKLERNSAERCSFSTFRTSNDKFTAENTENLNNIQRRSLGPVYTTLEFNNVIQNKNIPKREKTNYETVDFSKTLELNNNNKLDAKNQIQETDNEKPIQNGSNDVNMSIKEFINSFKTLEEVLKNKNFSDVIGSLKDLQEANELLNNIKQKLDEGSKNEVLQLFTPFREELSKLEKQVNTFRGLRRDLQYLILSSHVSKLYIDVKNIKCLSKEHEKRRHSFLEKINVLEKDLETKVDKNEEILCSILEEQVNLIQGRINSKQMAANK